MSTRSVFSPNAKHPLLTVSLKDHPSIKSLTEYFLSKANANPALRAVLEDALAPSSSHHIGLVLSERLINMPVQVIPPMYRMLADEINWAVEEVESHLTKFYVNSSMTRTNLSASSTTSS
jgi:protein BCP1